MAILGATSQIAGDLIVSLSDRSDCKMALFARRPEVVSNWLARLELANRHAVAGFDAFDAATGFDAVLNFVGVGAPATVEALGSSVFDATMKYDDLAIRHVRRHPDCRYIFLSSGAAYGPVFDEPADATTRAVVAINGLMARDWYSVGKLYAECRHRSLSPLPIIDVRVFSYCSHTQDISARFLFADILRALRTGERLITDPGNIVRDYIGPYDFYQLISRILEAPPANDVVDCYTKAPVDKMTVLSLMNERYGLRYEIGQRPGSLDATGAKRNYFSKNRRAAVFGYLPSKSSLECISDEVRLALAQ